MQVAQGGLAYTLIDSGELQRRLAHGERFAIIDARSDARIAQIGQTLPGAVRIPADELLTRKNEFPKGKTLLLLADAAERVERALELLRDGFTDVYVIDGGLQAYLRAGGRTVPAG